MKYMVNSLDFLDFVGQNEMKVGVYACAVVHIVYEVPIGFSKVL